MHPAPQIQEYLRVSATTTQKFIAATTTEKTWKQSPKSRTKKVKKYNVYMRYPSATANFWQTPLGRMQNRRTYDCWYWQQWLWVLCFQYKYLATISHILHHLKKLKKKTLKTITPSQTPCQLISLHVNTSCEFKKLDLQLQSTVTERAWEQVQGSWEQPAGTLFGSLPSDMVGQCQCWGQRCHPSPAKPPCHRVWYPRTSATGIHLLACRNGNF